MRKHKGGIGVTGFLGVAFIVLKRAEADVTPEGNVRGYVRIGGEGA